VSQTPTITNPPEQPALLQQAPVVPLDASGFTSSIVGTILFAITTLVLWLGDHTGLPLYILATGTGLGILLTAFTGWHRSRRTKSAARQSETDR
jgi:small basic protein